MNLEEAIKVAEAAIHQIEQRYLTDAEIAILRGAWLGKTYSEIANESRYEANYLKGDVGHKFWKLLSIALGETVSKRNFQAALERGRAKFKIEVNQTPLPAKVQQPQGQFLDPYVERPPIESLCYEEIQQPGALIRIKAPKLMGKTKLLNKILLQAQDQNYQTVSLSFELAERTAIAELDKFLRWFCIYVGSQLGLSNQLDNYWDDVFGSKVSCKAYFERYLLENLDRPLVLGLDELDRVFQYPEIAEEFLSLLRAWHEEAKRNSIFKKLRLILVHSREVNLPLNKNQSPFNVGLPVELPEFNKAQVCELTYEHGLNWEEAKVEQLMELVGGHPYLLEVALTNIDHNYLTFDQFLQTATESGLYRDYLWQCWLNLRHNPKLMEVMRKLLDNESLRLEEFDSELIFELYHLGLLSLEGSNVKIRCKLYSQYFQERLNVKQE